METAQGANMNLMLMGMLAIFVVFMIFSSRGQKKREVEKQKQIAALNKGAAVVLIGGIVGTVAGFKDNMIEVKISENTKITVLRSGIVSILDQGETK